MNRYIQIRRLRGPAFLLLVGVNALLAQAHIGLGWGKTWPLYLILAGVLALAERAALAAEGYPPPFPGAGYPGGVNPTAGPAAAEPASAIVPAHSEHFGNDNEGGQS